MENILGEDREILEQLAPYEVSTEVSVKADMPQLTLRRMRERYIKAGSATPPGPRPLHALPAWTDEFGLRLALARTSMVNVPGGSDIQRTAPKDGF